MTPHLGGEHDLSRGSELDSAVAWHDIECGAYRADIGLWLRLAAESGEPILDVGAGTGRVTLELARAGWEITALDRDARLLCELRRRAAGLSVRTALTDARAFDLEQRFALVAVPMQTIQLLGGTGGRSAFLRCAREHVRPGGRVALAVTERFDLYGRDDPPLAPDEARTGNMVYSSQPMAVRRDGDGFVIERRRELRIAGRRAVPAQENVVRLDRLSAGQLELEGRRAGFRALERLDVAATADHAGSVVVVLGG